ncbi:hypothetical protein [Prochlorococcus marinus]|uniref:hypothetical protein n=1 Tax=Prochlorococcus marinus TaxID=1219 RepID=UPI0022B3892A|nr:hypothetical protein [Prochlorococcus marinus]
MLIYLCLSSHGYGHAARQAAIFSELYRLRPDWQYVVSSVVDYEFLNLAFNGIPIIHRRIKWDIGTVQDNALTVDIEKTLYELNNFYLKLPEILIEESDWIKSQNNNPLIIGDIPPSASRLASLLTAPLIWMGNFGWDNIYSSYDNRFSEYISNISDDYSKGNILIRFPFSMNMNWKIKEHKVGLVVSQKKILPNKFLANLESIKKKFILISLGGMGFKLSKETFSKWRDFHFLINRENDINDCSDIENVSLLPRSLCLIDVMPYCYRVITKPGFSTFCEAISCNLGIHVVERKYFSEAQFLIEGLKKYGSFRLLSEESFYNGNWQLDKELRNEHNSIIKSDGALSSAEAVISYIEEI